MPETMIAFENVTKQYQMGAVKIDALTGVDFTVQKGEFAIIAGPSGAGKSTVLNILGGMDTPSGGRIDVNGREINAYDRKRLITYRRREIGFVFQFYNLVPNLTALENVELAVEICDHPFPPRDILCQVGLEDRINNFPAQLSGGEQQRVAIARALARDPELLVLDDSLSAVDAETEEAIVEALLADRAGKTTIIVSNRVSTLRRADLVAVLDGGRLAQFGSPAELAEADGFYAEIAALQALSAAPAGEERADA